ncbi:MAG: hypothetical protein E7298_13720 [Lachnospiraceae bacterium]|nr:hypothetical protein [Lachnospiraceae bacterium]
MDGFKEGFDFFSDHAADFSGIVIGDAYVESINNEINGFIDSVAHFKGMGSSVNTLKGDLAEFWHAGTFNIDAAVKGSVHRVQVDRSHDYGSVDVSAKNFEGSFGLKYYGDGVESAKQQAKSVFEKYKEYQSGGGKDTLDDYLSKRGFQDNSVLNDPVYSGQVRVIPADQYDIAKQWLERKIQKELTIRPEQAKRYQETLDLLSKKVSDGKGVESIELTEKEARELARLAKEGNIDPKELGLTTEELVKYEYILKQAFKAGLTAATISLVLKTAPEIINAIKYLIENGEIEEGEFKKIGFAAVKGASEGFVRGTVSASITAACKSGLLGEALKDVDPTIVGAVTVLAMDTIKNAYKVSTGEMTRNEMANELIRTMFTSTCSLALGAVSQSFIEIPVVGYMIGSFVGSLVGSFAYSAVYKPAISFCVDTGFTMFGLVEQDYQLPEDVMKEIGIDVFEYDQFDYETIEPEKFEFKQFEAERFEPEKIDMTFLRRGVIGVNEIGFLSV